MHNRTLDPDVDEVKMCIEFVRRLAPKVGLNVGDDHAVTVGGQLAGDGKTYAPCATGHHSNSLRLHRHPLNG